MTRPLDIKIKGPLKNPRDLSSADSSLGDRPQLVWRATVNGKDAGYLQMMPNKVMHQPPEEAIQFSLDTIKGGGIQPYVSWFPAHVFVPKPFRRKGVATRLYNAAFAFFKARHLPFKSGWLQTPGSQGLWKKMLEEDKAVLLSQDEYGPLYKRVRSGSVQRVARAWVRKVALGTGA